MKVHIWHGCLCTRCKHVATFPFVLGEVEGSTDGKLMLVYKLIYGLYPVFTNTMEL